MRNDRVFYFDGRSSERHHADLSLEGDQVLISLADRELRYPRAQVSLTPAVGSIPRSLRLPDGGRCELRDASLAALFELQPGGGGLSGLLHRLEVRPAGVLGALVLCVLLVSGFMLYGIPWLAKRAALALPPLMEQRLDRESLELLDRHLLRPSGLPAERRQAVIRLFTQVSSSFPPGLPYRVEFRDGGPLGANALALPGGTVLLTDQLLELADNDQGLQGVIAHELTHVVNRHALRTLLQSSATALVVASVTGDLTTITAIAATLPTVLAETRYSRAFEREADNGAVAWLRNQGDSPQPYAELLARLEAQRTAKSGGRGPTDGIRNYLSTHPDTAERIRRIVKQP
ncbi:M48 family metallopeptidase [Trichlorobacter ammonificans]|uniref:Peptidase M48 n=1 Tax=Trichlorobacter ammonificans TaxID=2916410 RepID=A0ABN8HJK2_9BACT|nr:M48 family metallopeptidase [Trichlorobacter ammonificans]CAH2031510.1 Peptidase M48 [Trichlorobacter ammonificans]